MLVYTGYITFLAWGGWHVYAGYVGIGQNPSYRKKRIQYNLWMDFATGTPQLIKKIKIAVMSGPLKGRWYLAKKEAPLMGLSIAGKMVIEGKTKYGIDVVGAAFKTEENGSITEKTDPVVIHLYINNVFVKGYTFDLINQVDEHTEIEYLGTHVCFTYKKYFAPGDGFIYEYLGFSPGRYKQVFIKSRNGYYSLIYVPCEYMGHTFYDGYWMVGSGQRPNVVGDFPIPVPSVEWTDNQDVQGLMWYRQDGKNFDINKPTIIWIHGWSDDRMSPYYTRFLYSDEFLSKGYNVGIFRYQKDIINCIYEVWGADDINVEKWGFFAVCRRCYNVTRKKSREYVVDRVWRNGGAGAKLRKALEEFFGQKALEGYNQEVTLLAHSTGAQVATLGLKSFYDGTNILSNLILTLVFLDPWIPPQGYVTYPGFCWEWAVPIYYGAYDPYIAGKILSSLSKKPNNNFIFCPLTDIPGNSSKTVLKTHLSYVFDKATFFTPYVYRSTAIAHKYGQMYNNTYWGNNNAGKFHFFAIDWYCKRMLGEPIPDDPKEEEEEYDPSP